jgi:tRNA dimethylallyltransferase
MDNRLPRTIPLRQGFGGQAHHSPIFKAHGVPELLAHLRGEMALEEAIRRAQQNTRHYAKRQTTWLRNQFPKARPVASAKEIFASIDGSG